MDQRDDNQQKRRFGRYRVTKALGQGGMGIVYLAEDPGIGREVAIKVLHVDPQMRADLRVEIQRRFEIEARSAGRLSHPNIVTIHDIGKEGEDPYIAMEYVQGESLEDVLASDRHLTFKEVSDLTTQLCRALDYAHAHGIVHRDIKPANILLAEDGQPKIVDFGVAKMGQALGSDAPRLTQVGTIIGTPAYMSPEQVTGHDVTPGSDQFSLAVIVYEMLAGQVPFSGDGATTVMYQIVHGEPKSLRSFDKRLHGEVDGAVFRALSKDPSERYEHCAEFARAVREALQSAPEAEELAGEPPADQTIVMPPPDATVVMSPEAAAPPDATVVMTPASSGGSETVVMPPPDATPPPQASQAATPAPAAAAATGPATAAPPLTAKVQELVARLAALPRPVLGGAAAVLLLIIAASAWLSAGSPATSDDPAEVAGATGPAAVAAPSFLSGRNALKPPNVAALDPAEAWRIRIAGTRGTELWVDGENSMTRVPGELELLGRRGDLVALELRRNGQTIAASEIRLGPYMPTEWPAAAVAETERRPEAPPAVAMERFEVVTRPAGARVRVNGSPVQGVTPLSIRVEENRRYELRIELDGHDPLTWAFTPAGLPAETREKRSLYFPLDATGTGRGPAGKLGGGSRLSDDGAPLDPIRIRGARMAPAEVLRKSEPRFPKWAADAGLPSYVILELVIDRQGRVRSTKVLREVHPDLERMAVEAIERWRFQPATREGAAVDAYFNVSVQFRRD